MDTISTGYLVDGTTSPAKTLSVTMISQHLRYGHGQGRANLEVVREALSRGHRVNIVASEIDRRLAEHPNVTLYLLEVRNLPTQMLRDLVFDLRARGIVKRLRTRSHIIHGNGAAVVAPTDINTAHFVHGTHAKFQPGWKGFLTSPYLLYQHGYTALNSVVERRCFEDARAVIAVSQRVAAELIELGIEAAKVSVIYNGVDLNVFSPGYEDRAMLGLPPGVPLGVFVGDIKGNRKNLDSVLKAMVLNDGLHLAVVAGLERTRAPQLAAELGIAGRVHFLGQRSDVAAVMRAADMLIFPSRYEPFGMVILEALACGLPVITSRAAGASEIIEIGSGVLLNNPDDVDELAAAMSLLTGDKLLRKEMGRRGRQVAEKYSWEHMARQYITAYEALAWSS